MGFRENLLHLRQERNMTQEQLAMLMGVSRQSVTKWEADKSYPEMDKLVKMCDLFGCTLDELVKGDLTQRTAGPGDVVSDSTLAEDVCGYDAHRRAFAWRMAFGVGLVVLGAAAGPLSDVQPRAAIVLFALVAAGLFFILPATFSNGAFKREHPFVIDFYAPEERRRIRTASGRETALGIAAILLSTGAVASFEDRMAVENPYAESLMLAGIACGVGLIVHASLSGGRTNVEEYNLGALVSLDRDEVAGLVGEGRADQVLAELVVRRRIGAASAVIMLLSTVVALALLFLAPDGVGSFEMFWVPWMLGGILCGVAAIVLRACSQKPERDLSAAASRPQARL